MPNTCCAARSNAFPHQPEAKIELARVFLEAGNDAKALQVATQALREHPRNSDLHALCAAANEQLGLLDEAANHWAAILAAEPNQTYSNLRLAALLRAAGRSARAPSTACGGSSRPRGGQDLDAITSLGIALSADGQHDEALELLSTVAKARPDARLGPGATWRTPCWPPTASRMRSPVSRRRCASTRESAQAYCGLGLAYQRIQRWHEAAESFRTTEQLAPDQAVGPYNLGLALAALGEPEEARSALLRAAALEPDDLEIREALQSLLAQPAAAGDPAAAPRRASAATSRPSRCPRCWSSCACRRRPARWWSRRGAEPAIVRLVRGQVTSASAPGVKRLGEALVARGIITPAALESALARQRRDDGESAEALGARCCCASVPATANALTRAVFQQVLDALDEMLTWNEGAFSFHPGSDRGLPAIAFDLQNVMLEIMRIADERKATSSST